MRFNICSAVVLVALFGAATYDANVEYSFVYEPTPEPSLLLVTGALLGMIAVRTMVGRRN
jgi:CBS-domain-containing membrane protein